MLIKKYFMLFDVKPVFLGDNMVSKMIQEKKSYEGV